MLGLNPSAGECVVDVHVWPGGCTIGIGIWSTLFEPRKPKRSGIESTEELNNGWDSSVSTYGAGGATVSFGDEEGWVPSLACFCGMPDLNGEHDTTDCIPGRGHPWSLTSEEEEEPLIWADEPTPEESTGNGWRGEQQ